MLWSLALVPILGGAALWRLGGDGRLRIGVVASGVLFATLALAITATASGVESGFDWGSTLSLTAALTPVSATMAILVPIIALPVLAYAAAHEERRGLARLLGVLLIFVGGMELLVIADDLLTLLIGWELVGACSWGLIGHAWRDGENPGSGLYAFVVTRFGDLGLFAAAMATFAATGALGYDSLAALDGAPLQIAAFGLLLSAAAKSGQVPFSPWLFRAMAGPTSVSALLHAATMVAAGAYLMIRLGPELARAPGFSEALIAIGLVTALLGGLVAVLQNHAKKLLAASTSAQFGLMFVAVGAGYPGIALVHLVAHAAFKALLFLAAGMAGDRAGGYALDRMGFARALPVVALLSAVGALALAAVPPLGAAWSKEQIVAAAGHVSATLAGGVMLAGALSAAYAARFQILAYGFAKSGEGVEPPTLAERAAMALLAAATLALSLLWWPPAEEAIATVLGVEALRPGLGETVASLLLLGLGLLVGVLLARAQPDLGAQGSVAVAADWLDLPAALRVGVSDPVLRLARIASGVDDRWIDALPRAVASGGRGIAGAFAVGDGRVVDRGVVLTAEFARWLAWVSDRFGEWSSDGIPRGTGWIVGSIGRDARRLQTGLSHHYYALLMLGALAMIAVLFIGL